MQRTDVVKTMIGDLLRQFASELHGRRVFLFGSRAAGTARERSDFDIGIDGPTPLPSAVKFRIEDRLEQLPTLYKIDVVDFATVSSAFRQYALQHTEDLP